MQQVNYPNRIKNWVEINDDIIFRFMIPIFRLLN